METNQLIEAIAVDARKPLIGTDRVLQIVSVLAVVLAATIFYLALGPRADIVEASQTPRFLFKFLFTLAILGTGYAAFFSIARPEATLRSEIPLLFLAPILLSVALGLEVIGLTPEEMKARWLGTNLTTCLTFIPLIGLGPLAVFLLALRHSAPTRPTFAGVVAGLAAGGLAATLYAAHCVDDSPLFVSTWYTIGIVGLAIVGGLAGRFGLRW
ncbi:MAG: DUF1109 family protein [Rhizobiaceae bacterium]|nr:DUF1109 family protein [Rhizobiaceae bacterium]